jgi:multidrug transporter EmrE-like cation transporter
LSRSAVTCFLHSHFVLCFHQPLFTHSVVAFAVSLGQIEVGTAYAVWSALGTALVSLVGVIHFHESCDWQKVTCISLILIGVLGLNLREQ